MTEQTGQVWDIRYAYGGVKRGFCWEVFCWQHNEVDQRCLYPEDAIKRAEYLNDQEGGRKMRTRRAINTWTEQSWQVTEHWEHTPRPGFPAGWR